MSVMYVTDQGASLHKSQNRLYVKKNGEVIQWVHHFNIEQVVIFGNINITTSCIAFLLEKGIDTVFLTVYGKYRGRLLTQWGKNIELRKLQFSKLSDNAFKLAQSRIIIKAKIKNEMAVLRKNNYIIRDIKITEVIRRLKSSLSRTERAEDLDALMGYEGDAARIYFSVFNKLIRPPEFHIEKRTRRPPKDPFNALLSFGYALLANEVQQAVNITGLDPYLGSLHSMKYGRPSLVLDLMEEFRPLIIDRLVIKLINQKRIRFSHFFISKENLDDFDADEETEYEREDMPVRLTHEGIKTFIVSLKSYLSKEEFYPSEEKNLAYRDIIRRQTRLFIKCLKGEADYQPYVYE